MTKELQCFLELISNAETNLLNKYNSLQDSSEINFLPDPSHASFLKVFVF